MKELMKFVMCGCELMKFIMCDYCHFSYLTESMYVYSLLSKSLHYAIFAFTKDVHQYSNGLFHKGKNILPILFI